MANIATLIGLEAVYHILKLDTLLSRADAYSPCSAFVMGYGIAYRRYRRREFLHNWLWAMIGITIGALIIGAFAGGIIALVYSYGTISPFLWASGVILLIASATGIITWISS